MPVAHVRPSFYSQGERGAETQTDLSTPNHLLSPTESIGSQASRETTSELDTVVLEGWCRTDANSDSMLSRSWSPLKPET